jgi:hypothetical protein
MVAIVCVLCCYRTIVVELYATLVSDEVSRPFREHMTASRASPAYLGDIINERVIHMAPICPLRSGIGPLSSSPLVLCVVLSTAEPTPLSATVALTTQRSH